MSVDVNTQLQSISNIIIHDLQSSFNDLETALQYPLPPLFSQILKRHGFIIESIKDWVKFIDDEYLKKEFVDINDLILFLKVFYESSYSNVKINILNDFPLLLLNKSLFILLIDNLIKNGIRHNNKDEVVIDISFENFVISVRDNGGGLCKEDFTKFLVPFKKSDKSEGLGLGLTICDEIVKKHGWTWDVTCSSNIYTKICIKTKI